MKSFASAKSAGALVVLGLLIASVTEVVKDASIAYRYGKASQADAYFVALSLPLLFGTVLWSATNVALVPFFTSQGTEPPERPRDLARRVAILLALGALGVALVLAAAAPLVVRILAPGFEASQVVLATQMLRLLSLTIPLAAVGGVGLAYLNSAGWFFLPGLNNAFRNLVVIVGLSLPIARRTIWVLPVVMFTGICLQNLLAWPAIVKANPKESVGISWGDPTLWRSARATGLPLAGLLINNSITLVEQLLATTLGPGAVALLVYGSRLPLGVAGLMGSGFSTGALPEFSRLASSGRSEELRASVRETLRVLLVILVPAMALLAVLSPAVTQLLFSRGALSSSDAEVVGSLMSVYALALFASGVNGILIAVLWAQHDTKTATRNLVVTKLLNAALCMVLLSRLGLRGLALASVIAGCAQMAMLWAAVRQSIGSIVDRHFLVLLSKVVFASASAAGLAYVVYYAAIPRWGDSIILSFAALSLAAGAGVGGFAVLCHVVGLKEPAQAVRILLGAVRGRVRQRHEML